MHTPSCAALNFSALDHFLILLFTDYFAVEQKDGIGSKRFSYSSVRIFSVFVLSGTLTKTVAMTFPCYGSGDVLLKAARHENIVKVANSGTLRLINIYL